MFYYRTALFCVEVTFFSLVAGMSIVSGFATTLMLAKRQDSEMFDKVIKVLFLLEIGLSNISTNITLNIQYFYHVHCSSYCDNKYCKTGNF